MQTRRLGTNGPLVSAVGLGAMSFAGVYGGSDDTESEDTVRRAIDLGVNFVDTANVYGAGRSEQVVGRAVQGRREHVVIATKFGGGGRDGLGKRAGVRPFAEESLRNLATDYIDL
ncbi:MAG TPA: aldo/keto reductase, partial [Candidatus Dormibacteraeota bacterium]